MASKRKHKRKGAFVLAIGDTHAFHKTGLTPEGFQSSTGAVITLNQFQRYLWDCWTHFLNRPDLPKRIDVLLPNGDLAEGQNYAEEARALSEVDPSFQARGVAHLYGSLARRVPWARKPGGWTENGDGTAIKDGGVRHIYAQQGSFYHSGRGAAIEEMALSMLRAQRGSDGHFTQPWRDNLIVNGVLFDVAHCQSIVSRYKAMPLEREGGFWLERMGRLMLQGRTKDLPFKHVVMIRSHAHYGFRVWQEEHMTFVSLPSWKLMDGYVKRGKMPNRCVPENLGCAGVWVKGTPDDPRVEVVPYLYDHPQEEWEVVNVG